MASRPRGPVPAGIYHVHTRTAGPVELFRDDVDRTVFCKHLVRRLKRSNWTCLAFCLMRTHYHLVLEVPDESLQAGMKCLNGHYAQEFNARHGRSGHLFGNRYRCRMVMTDAGLARCFRYVARNPVAAGVCRAPEGWYWSSYCDTVGLANEFPWVDSSRIRELFSDDPRRAMSAIRLYVEDAAVWDKAA